LLGITLPGVIQAGIVTLAVNESANMAEIIRASINSVDVGQMEAAESLGLRRGAPMRHVILPQAMRIVIPPLGNEFNNMMKVTSLLSVIGVEELFLNAQELNSTTFQTFEIFLAAAVYYLALTTIWGVIQSWIERRLAAGSGESSGPGLGSRLSERAGAWRSERRGERGDGAAHRSRRGRAQVLRRARGLARRHAPGGARAAAGAVIGPSGSGKTTLLRCINHLERIDSGRIEVNGHPVGYRTDAKGRLREASPRTIARQREDIGFVLQRFNLSHT